MARAINRLRAVHPGEILREDFLAPPGLECEWLVPFLRTD
jgi:plasmid maintenance system antidote protein VapI